jgi:Fic family protein
MPSEPRFDPTLPYNGLPALPPKVEIETRRVLKKCVAARAGLAALNEAAKLIPNQTVLINTIPLSEAKNSSEIENIVTTNDKLFQYANDNPESADPQTKETLRYRTALIEGYRELKKRPLTTATAIKLCRIIKGVDLDIRKTPGTTLRQHRTGQIIYTPPEGEALLRDKLANWERFLHEATEIDPVVRMAIGHYQFEAIHPFVDGNGRTGRILNILYLLQQELLELPIIYLSRYINDHRSDYYSLLLEVTRQEAWEGWILFMLEAVEQTSNSTRAKVHAIRRLMEETVRYVSRELPKIYSRELVEVLFTQPYCRVSDLVEADLGHRNTSAKHLKDLTKAGVLEDRKIGRERLYINTRLLGLLAADSNEHAPFDG